MRAIRVSLAETAVLLLILTLFVSAFALVDQNKRARQVVVARALENAVVLSNFAATAHIQYADSIQAYAKRSGDEFTMDPVTNPESIRFPATYSRILTAEFSERYPGTSFKIYSRFPFGGEGSRILDTFARDALRALEGDPTISFSRIEPVADGSQIVRHAAPIVMRQGCVACHNSPQWDIAKHDWQVGDVRGVREVSITLPPTALHTQSEMLFLLALILASCGLGAFLVYPAVRREVAQKSYFHSLSTTLDSEARQLKQEAHTDVLSGLGNRRFFDATLKTLVRQCRGSDTPLTLVVLDVDHFKSVNDMHGHVAGDRVIAAIGQTLSANLRPQDSAARIGGEEFAILAPATSLVNVLDMVERIRRLLGEMQFYGDGRAFRVTLSAGLAVLNATEDHAAFYARADALLYQAKETGRDRACWKNIA